MFASNHACASKIVQLWAFVVFAEPLREKLIQSIFSSLVFNSNSLRKIHTHHPLMNLQDSLMVKELVFFLSENKKQENFHLVSSAIITTQTNTKHKSTLALIYWSLQSRLFFIHLLVKATGQNKQRIRDPAPYFSR